MSAPFWKGLSGGLVADEANRTAHHEHKARAYATAQRDGILDNDFDPHHLVFLIIGLAALGRGCHPGSITSAAASMIVCLIVPNEPGLYASFPVPARRATRAE